MVGRRRGFIIPGNKGFTIPGSNGLGKPAGNTPGSMPPANNEFDSVGGEF